MRHLSDIIDKKKLIDKHFVPPVVRFPYCPAKPLLYFSY